MPGITFGPNYRTPFGPKQYRGSTAVGEFVSRTLAASTVPSVTIDGFGQKVLQSGTMLMRITSGPEKDKVGPYQSDATDGRQTDANFEGFCDTFLPWQLQYGDENVAVLVRGTVVQENCEQLVAGGASFEALTDAAKAIVLAQKPTLMFHKNSLALTDQA